MHELSLAIAIARIAEGRLGPRRCPSLVEVGVAVGNDANVDPASLAFCLDVVFHDEPFGQATAVLVPESGEDLRVDYLEVNDADPED